MTDLPDLPAAIVARRISAGALAPADYAEALIERIGRDEPRVRAFAHRDDAVLRRAARSARPGPLQGLPVGVKDVLDTAEMPTGAGSPIWKGHRPRADAACVAMARHAGGLVAGKTVTTEFATTFPGPTTNPHNAAHTPGGSSQGSAAGVAAGFFPLAFGTQTAGSIIRPAAFCGVVGFKPSHGLVHRGGMRVMSEGLDTIGALARDVSGCAMLVEAVSGIRLGDPGQRVGTAPRILLVHGPGEALLSDDTKALLSDAATRLARAGAVVTEKRLPDAVARGAEAQPVVMNGESAHALRWEYDTVPALLSEVLRSRLEWGADLPPQALFEARAVLATARAAFADLMREHDVILTASAPGEAPEGLDSTGNPACNALWTGLHGPCVTFPAGTGPKGLPLGVQLVGAPGSDGATLAWAEWARGVLD